MTPTDWVALGWTLALCWNARLRDVTLNMLRPVWERIGRFLLWSLALDRWRTADLFAVIWIGAWQISNGAPHGGFIDATEGVVSSLLSLALLVVIYAIMRHCTREFEEQEGAVKVLPRLWSSAVVFAAIALGPNLLIGVHAAIRRHWWVATGLAAEAVCVAVLFCEPPKRTAPAALRARWAARTRATVLAPTPG
jgi:hypothetical protein